MDLTQVPPFYLLNGQLGWRDQCRDGLSLGGASGIRLAADTDPEGPLSLAEPGGSLGGVVLPRRVAVDASGLVYLLERRRPWRLRRYNPEQAAFEVLPAIGGPGADPRQFDHPGGMAAAGRVLIIADAGNRRAQVFDINGLALHALWGPEGDRQGWQPVDAAANESGRTAYLLDFAGKRVYRTRAPFDRAALWLSLPAEGHYTRIAVDQAGRVYILDRRPPDNVRLLCYGPDGAYQGAFSQSGDVRDRFTPPPLRLLHDARQPSRRPYFCLPDSLSRLCGRQVPLDPPSMEIPLGLCPPFAQEGKLFRLDGSPAEIDMAEVLEPLLYQTQGTYITGALDSGRYHCQWHRVELDVASLPPGAKLTVSTYADDDPSPLSLIWSEGLTVAGNLNTPHPPAHVSQSECGSVSEPSPLHGEGETEGSTQTLDFLVQSRQGQYLWLKIAFEGDGFGSPAVTAIRVYFPRESYLNYLPAIYSMEEEQRWFLERFLSIFQADWDGLERQVTDVVRLFDPSAVPEGGFMDDLAAKLGLTLEQTWSGAQKRALIRSVPQVYPRRGTPAGLHAYLQSYVESMTGVPTAQQGDFPRLVECFRLRKRMLLPGPDPNGQAQARMLWGPEEVGRLQIGVYARAGEARLVDTGDPRDELFQEFAHRFKVYVPACWVRTLEDERMFRRAVDTEKPVQTDYDLCLVEARYQVGIQATLGLDTILGEVPQARLTSPELEAQSAPSRAPRSRLGYDTVLGGVDAPRRLPVQVGEIIK